MNSKIELLKQWRAESRAQKENRTPFQDVFEGALQTAAENAGWHLQALEDAKPKPVNETAVADPVRAVAEAQ